MSAHSSRRTNQPENSDFLKLIVYSRHWDEQYYLERNPDLTSGGLSPAMHFLLYGGFEGRDPGRSFSTRLYLNKRPYLTAARVAPLVLNPLVHYELYGGGRERDVQFNPHLLTAS